MSPISRAVLAERAAAIRRHLSRVAEKLPTNAASLEPSTDAADAVMLHLWQATQIVIDLALAAVLIVLGAAVWTGAVSLFGYALLLALSYDLFVRYYEEPVLRRAAPRASLRGLVCRVLPYHAAVGIPTAALARPDGGDVQALIVSSRYSRIFRACRHSFFKWNRPSSSSTIPDKCTRRSSVPAVPHAWRSLMASFTGGRC